MLPPAALAEAREKDLALLRRRLVAERRLGCRIAQIGGRHLGKLHPAMHIFGPCGLLRHRKFGVGNCADSQADKMRHALGLTTQLCPVTVTSAFVVIHRKAA